MRELEEAQEFFAPSNEDAIDALLAEHQAAVEAIAKVADMMESREARIAFSAFRESANLQARNYIPDVDRMFDADAARKALDAQYWDKALKRTDVLEYMPAGRRDEWRKQVEQHDTPEFEEATVRATLRSLLDQRSQFLAEMVDGLFFGLSREHVTNRPEGFTKRFILNNVFTTLGASYGKADHIHDLRCIIAKFMGDDPPSYGATRNDLDTFRQSPGVWHTWDGGALRVRCFKKGTAHLEVHEDMALRLNQILASLHPGAIPEKSRRPTQSKAKRPDPILYDQILPRPVRSALSAIAPRPGEKRTWPEPVYGDKWGDKAVSARAREVLAAIGGVRDSSRAWQFGYPVREVLLSIAASGVIPDAQAYQYYPTPAWLADELVEAAGIQAGDSVLEPSAGIGGIIDRLPDGVEVQAIEIADTHRMILEQAHPGAEIVDRDFLEHQGRHDRIVMNPPFSQGRWQAHAGHAMECLAPGGTVAAILPESATRKLSGWQFGPVRRGAFPGVSVDVVVGVYRR